MHLFEVLVLGAIAVHPVPAELLCLVHGGIRLCEKLFHICAVPWKDRQPQAYGKAARRLVEVEVFDRLSYLLRGFHALGLGESGQVYGELVAAQPRKNRFAVKRGRGLRVRIFQHAFENLRDPPYVLVSGAVATGVVQELELVHVYEAHDGPSAAPGRHIRPFLDELNEPRAVDKPGEVVVVGQVFDPLL